MDEDRLHLLRLLLARLERISADSYWAHQASGVRGALLRVLEKIDRGESIPKSELRRTIETGFSILKNAAVERVKH